LTTKQVQEAKKTSHLFYGINI